MKQKIVLVAFMLGIALNMHLRAEDKPERQIPIILQDDEIQEILADKESYVYFGPEVTTLVDDLPIIHGCASEQNQEHLDAVCALIAAGKTTAPARVLKAALEEAASCLNVMHDVSKDDVEKLAASIETYYQQLEDGKVELIVNDATGQEILDKTFINRFFKGNITVAGNATIKGNENVYGNLTVNSDETILGNVSVGQNETIGGNLTVNGQIIANNSAITLCDVILPAATPGATVNVTNCGFIELGGASPSTSNVDIYEVTGSGQGRNLFAGNYTTVPAALTTAADNIAIGTNALTSIATGTSNIAIGVNAANMTVAAQNGVAIGTNATMSSDSVVIGHAATSTGAQRSIVIGSIDSTNAVGAPPRSSAINAIAIGSSASIFAGASATGVGSIAFGGSDGTGAGASVTTLDGIAIGAGTSVTGANSVALGANTTVAQSNAIVLGNVGTNAVSVGIGTNQPTAKLTIVGTGAGGVTPLRLVTPPLQTSTDFLLTIDASGNVRQTSSTTAFSSLSFAPCNVILPAATAGTTITNTTCGFIELGGTSPSASNVDIYEVTGSGQGRNLFAGNYSTVPAALTTAADNIAIGTNALASIATGTSNIAIGVNAANITVAAQNGIAIGTNVTMSTDSVVIGHAATSTGAQRSIVIGSIDSTNAVGAAPTAGAVDAIAIGSASGALAGASATGVGSIALGGSDGTGAGASVTTLDGIAIGAGTSVTGANSVALGANTTVAQSNAIILGNIGLNTLSVGIGTNQPTAKLTVVGTGAGNLTPLRLVTPPLQTSTDFLLTIDASGNVRQTSSTTAFSSLSFAPCNVILPAATAGTTITNTTCGFIELGGASPSASNVDIYEVTGTGAGRSLFVGNYTTVPAVTTASDNIAMGINALQAITTGTGNIAVGGFANTTLTTANNTIAIGTSSVATATDSIVFGNGSNTASSRAIVIGSRDSTNGTGAAPTAGAVDAIAIGSASGTHAGASAAGTSSIAIGASDGVVNGAQNSGIRSIAIGTTASIGSTSNDSIVIGSRANTSQKCTIVIGSNDNNGGGLAPSATGINAIAIGSANAGVGGAFGAGLASIAIGGADGTVNGALNFGARSIAIGTATDVSTVLCNDSIVIGSSANTTQKCTIVIGSSDNNGGGLAPSASGVNAIVIGSANAGVGGASGAGLASIAIGGSDGSVNGATVNLIGARSVAIGNGAVVSQSDAIVLGNVNINAVSVGIGTNTPTAKLTVSGTGFSGLTPLRLIGLPTGTFNVLSADGSGNVYQTVSSRQYKENFRPIDPYSQKLYSLNPIVFDYKKQYNGGKSDGSLNQFGLIAEEVELHLPELIIYDDAGNANSVRYLNMIALLLNETKHHQQKLDELLYRMEKIEKQSR